MLWSADCNLLLLRLDQHLDQLAEGGVGTLVDLFRLHRADGMLHDQHRMIRRAERRALGRCQRLEGLGDDGNRQAAAFLNFDGVVDTPRRARTSIAKAAEDEIRLGR